MKHEILRLELLDLLGCVAVVALLSGGMVGSILIVTGGGAVHVIGAGSTPMLLVRGIPASPVHHPSRLHLEVHISMALNPRLLPNPITVNKKHYNSSEDGEEKRKELETSSNGGETFHFLLLFFQGKEESLYESKREAGGAEHGLDERRGEETRLSDCTGGHINGGRLVPAAVVQKAYVVTHPSPSRAGAAVEKSPKTHENARTDFRSCRFL